MKKGVDKVFLDTNVLVYSIDIDCPFFAKARELVEEALSGRLNAYVCPQILGEFYSVITNPRRTAKPLTHLQALREVRALFKLPMIFPPKETYAAAFDFVEKYKIVGRRYFDAQIVASMQANGIETIYTLNVKDFQPFSEVKTVNPFE